MDKNPSKSTQADLQTASAGGAEDSPGSPGRFAPMRVALICTFLFLVGLAPVVWMTDQVLRTNARDRVRLETHIRLARFGDSITAAVNRRLTLLSAVATFAESHEESEDLHIFVSGLFSTVEGLTAVRLIHEDHLEQVFPDEDTAQLPSPEFQNESSPRARALRQAIRTHRITVVDPDDPDGLDGPQLLTAYQTIYSATGVPHLTVSITFELNPILGEVGLESEPDDLHLVLRTSSGRSFHGRPIVFEDEPVISEIDGRGYSWELVAVPRDGWDSIKTGEFRMLRAAGISITTLLAILVYLIVGYQERLKSEVRSRTSAYQNANRALQRGVSERQQAIEELQETSFALTHAMPGIARLDPRSRFQHVNDGLAAMLGAEPDEVVKEPWQSFIHPDDHAVAGSACDTAREQGKAELEVRARRRDGSLFFCQALLVRRDDQEAAGFLGFHLFSQDITGRKERERRERDLYDNLARAKRMESIGKLAGGVAHDLNNILGPLVAYPDLILDDLPPDHPIRADVIAIREGSLNARRVIQDLLTLARRSRNEHHPVDLNRVVSDHLESATFRELQGQHPDIDVRMALNPTPLMVLGSRAQLLQVLMNLTSNAFEAMTETGILTLRTRSHTIPPDTATSLETEPGEHALLIVEDTGVGIDPAHLDQIYEPFYSTKTMDRSGSGLGLTVTYGVVRDHEGCLEVSSEPGQGAQFRISIPLTAETEPEPQPIPSSEVPHGSESILVVDDRETQRELAARILGQLGYDVRSVEHGHAALDYLRDNDVDLVLLDMIMEEGFDGLDTYQAIHGRNAAQRCIIASGYAAGDRVKEAMDQGVMAYLPKPYTRQNIGFLVRRILDQSPPPEEG